MWRTTFTEEQNAGGEFVRQDDEFRERVSSDGSTRWPAVCGRYHLYISLACPWASRTLIVRNLLGLEDCIGVTVVDPIRDERGWAFRDGPGYSRDPINGFTFLSEAYRATEPGFRGRVTVPVLWDKEERRIVNNSEDDICRMFNDAFSRLGTRKVDLFPKGIEAEHAKLSEFIYENVNNGVYRAGFAATQGRMIRRARLCSTRWTRWRRGWRTAGISSATASWKRTGVSSARWCGSTRCTTGTSSATSAASKITGIYRVISWTCTSSPASRRL